MRSEVPTPSGSHLTQGTLLARNTIWNLVGNGAPLLAALFSIPQLTKALGTDRFGIITLSWVTVGYFSLFDLGLGRAVTKLVAERLGAHRGKEIPSLFWTSLWLMLGLGLVGGALAIFASPWLVYHVLKVPTAIVSETLVSFYLLGAIVPVVITTSALRGLLEAYQRFEFVNAIRIPLGVLTFAGPLAALPFSHSLVPVIAIMVGVRVGAWLAHLLLCLQILPELRRAAWFQRDLVGPLLRFGSWMTVSNIISPLLAYMDRFVVGAVLSVTAVAYYAVPFEVVTKLLLIPGAIVTVLFPAISTSFVEDGSRTSVLFSRGLKYTFLALFPACMLVVLFSHEALNLWLGTAFAESSFRVLQWLAIGVLVNSLAHVPFFTLQGIGRPDLSAKIHAVELPLYVVLLWSLLHAHGIVGAAVAWTARATLDCAAMLLTAQRCLGEYRPVLLRARVIVFSGFLLLLACFLHMSFLMKGVFFAVAVASFALLAWLRMLDSSERSLVRSWMKLQFVQGCE